LAPPTERIDRRRARPRFRTRSLASRAVAAPLLVLAGGCAAPPAQGPPVVFISLDTLRRDQVGAYRPEGASFTPHLDRLAASSVVFDDAWVTIPFTLPSHLSMFTGLYPDVHRVLRKKVRLNDLVPTLPALLAARGYRTLGLVSIEWMDGKFGFARGFDHYERIGYALTYSDRLNARLFELLDARAGDGRPPFLFLHYIDPHSDFFNVGQNRLPYYARPDYLARIGVESDTREFCTPADECATDFLMAANRDRFPLGPAELARLAALYRGGVEYLDRDLGDLFAGLEERGLFDRALIVVTSDHGEELREHGEFIHSQPYVEDMAAPLLVHLPGGRLGGTRRSGLTDSVDLLPTILELVGAEIPPHVQGASLVPLIEEGRPVRPWTLGRDKLVPSRYSLRTLEHCLIHDFESGASQLYDLASDPGERRDVAADHPERVAELRRTLTAAVGRNREQAKSFRPAPVAGEGVLTAEEQRRLRALGYLE
jgi:arylsulfatase A-like enzyme